MIWLTTGPNLRDRIKRILREQLETTDCRVMYWYVDAQGRRAPEYAATHLQIRAFSIMSRPTVVKQIEETLSAVPHCISTERIERHATLRPQVLALFERVSS
jgi:hypothetical protein